MRRLSCVEIIRPLKHEVHRNTVPTSQNNTAPPLPRPTISWCYENKGKGKAVSVHSVMAHGRVEV